MADNAEANAEGKSVRVRRELEGGINEAVELPMPAVLTIQYGINQPRYASLKGIMQAKKKPVDQKKLADLGVHRLVVPSVLYFSDTADALARFGDTIIAKA